MFQSPHANIRRRTSPRRTETDSPTKSRNSVVEKSQSCETDLEQLLPSEIWAMIFCHLRPAYRVSLALANKRLLLVYNHSKKILPGVLDARKRFPKDCALPTMMDEILKQSKQHPGFTALKIVHNHQSTWTLDNLKEELDRTQLGIRTIAIYDGGFLHSHHRNQRDDFDDAITMIEPTATVDHASHAVCGSSAVKRLHVVTPWVTQGISLLRLQQLFPNLVDLVSNSRCVPAPRPLDETAGELRGFRVLQLWAHQANYPIYPEFTAAIKASGDMLHVVGAKDLHLDLHFIKDLHNTCKSLRSIVFEDCNRDAFFDNRGDERLSTYLTSRYPHKTTIRIFPEFDDHFGDGMFGLLGPV
eukprot:m.274774 g.274774  ORF g.274774 m.274774 type:complete len:357 (-) comp115001_c0_seq1:89-1159(-)